MGRSPASIRVLRPTDSGPMNGDFCLRTTDRRRRMTSVASGYALAALVATAALAPAAAAQESTLPFAVGERLEYVGRVRGLTGRGSMWVNGPVLVRGISTYELHFDFTARVGPLSVTQRTVSWLDPERMAVMRFAKYERHLLARHQEDVELFPTERRWRTKDGESGESRYLFSGCCHQRSRSDEYSQPAYDFHDPDLQKDVFQNDNRKKSLRCCVLVAGGQSE